MKVKYTLILKTGEEVDFDNIQIHEISQQIYGKQDTDKLIVGSQLVLIDNMKCKEVANILGYNCSNYISDTLNFKHCIPAIRTRVLETAIKYDKINLLSFGEHHNIKGVKVYLVDIDKEFTVWA